MSQPTKEQWTEIQGQLNSQFTTTYLDCDGYLIAARMVRSKNKLVIQVYVDGYIDGKWIKSVKTIDEFAEVPKRFYRHARKNIWPRKLVKDMEKLLGKRRCKEEGYYGERYTSFPWFNSAETFISHLKKHNQSIELLDHTTYQQRLTAKQAQEQTA
jgi:hypothetical protein